jgi:DNA-binding LacI/PurR family transcriptional regulator
MLDMGCLAAKLVLEAIASGKPASPPGKLLHLLPPELVERDSTRKLIRRNSAKKAVLTGS